MRPTLTGGRTWRGTAGGRRRAALRGCSRSPLFRSWLNNRKNDSEKAHLPGLFEKYIEPVQEELRRNFKTVVPIRHINQVMSTCWILEGLLPEKVDSPEVMEQCFAYALWWAFGGALVVDKKDNMREKLHEFLLVLFAGNVHVPKEPAGATCFDFMYRYDAASKTGEFVHFSTMLQEYVPVPVGNAEGQTPFRSIVVPTVDSIASSAIMSLLVYTGHACMFVGTAGTGKTTLVKEYLRTLDEERFISTVINVNYYMDSSSLQALLDGSIDKRSGKVYGPKAGKKLIYYVDDLNLPYLEQFGTQNALSLLRQVMDHRQCYDRDALDICKELVDVQFVSSMNPTSGSFTIDERLQRHFATFACVMPGVSDLRKIYQSVLEGHFATFSPDVAGVATSIVNASIALHEAMCLKFLPSATRFVYNWNMRELSNLMQNVCLARGDFYKSTLKVSRLWVHECRRVFGDRLISDVDADKFSGTLKDYVSKFLPDALEEVWMEPNIHTSFAFQPAGGGEALYLPVLSMDRLAKTLNDKLEVRWRARVARAGAAWVVIRRARRSITSRAP